MTQFLESLIVSGSSFDNVVVDLQFRPHLKNRMPGVFVWGWQAAVVDRGLTDRIFSDWLVRYRQELTASVTQIADHCRELPIQLENKFNGEESNFESRLTAAAELCIPLQSITKQVENPKAALHRLIQTWPGPRPAENAFDALFDLLLQVAPYLNLREAETPPYEVLAWLARGRRGAAPEMRSFNAWRGGGDLEFFVQHINGGTVEQLREGLMALRPCAL